jgi:hypothetical protein
MQTLNPLQLEILKLFQHAKSEEELLELKDVLINYLSQKTTKEADKAFEKKGHTQDDIEKWKTEHFSPKK